MKGRTSGVLIYTVYYCPHHPANIHIWLQTCIFVKWWIQLVYLNATVGRNNWKNATGAEGWGGGTIASTDCNEWMDGWTNQEWEVYFSIISMNRWNAVVKWSCVLVYYVFPLLFPSDTWNTVSVSADVCWRKWSLYMHSHIVLVPCLLPKQPWPVKAWTWPEPWGRAVVSGTGVLAAAPLRPVSYRGGPPWVGRDWDLGNLEAKSTPQTC